ncbi:hypothetical protein GOV06_01530 [Candidatus Woesearchaeota archaeon]|nr:hypothetical protein [Candidatus Woesearchaeota archaeon]
MKIIILIGIILMLMLSGCGKVEEVPEAAEEPEVIKLECPASCDDGNECTKDFCSEDTGYKCVNEDLVPCCGNGKCEKGEKDCVDCPACNDYDKCTEDYFDVDSLKCVNEDIMPCCGNDECEAGEDCDNCLLDCNCGIDLKDYPGIFKGKSVVIVVGAKASASDVTAGIDVANGLGGYTIDTKLDNEISSLDDRNVIVIGTPCDNEFSAELLPYSRDCLEYIKEGTAVIRIFSTGSGYAVLVAGNPISKTREAASYLREDSSKKLEGVEVIV